MGTGIKLYELSDEYLRALSDLPESGLDEQTIADTLEGLEGALTVKAQAVLAYCLNLEAEADAVEMAAKRMQARAKTLKAQYDSLRGYLHANMLKSGITEIKAVDGTFRARIRDNPEAVEVIAPEHIPEEYMREVPARLEPDKALIKDAIKRGETVPGAMLTRTTRLEIKT
jgi:hypothetical protein